MQILAEQPLILSLMIGLIAGTFIYMWMNSGQKGFGIAGLVIALLIPLVWTVASTIQTDREQITAIIHRTAQAVQDNDHDLAVSVIEDEEAKLRARADLPKYVFERVRAGNIVVRDIAGSNPRQADVELTATVIASDKRGQFKNIRVPRRVMLTFEQRGEGEWVVIDYNHTPLNGRPDAYSPARVSSSRLNRGN